MTTSWCGRASAVNYAWTPTWKSSTSGAAPAERLEILSRSSVDVVLLDSDAVGNEAVQFISMAREAGYQGKILVLASEKDIGSLFRPLRAGASGIFLKHSSLDALPRAIRQVAAGEAWVDLEIVQLLAGSIIERGNRNLGGHIGRRHKIDSARGVSKGGCADAQSTGSRGAQRLMRG